jgi:putative transcriptional regulator
MRDKDFIKENLIKKICGEIVLSQKPGLVIKKWRNIFKVSQKEIAKEMEVTPSVISDYESNRRSSPGIKIINKIVNALIKISERKGGEFLREFYTLSGNDLVTSSILDVKEFKLPITVKEFCEKTNCSIVGREDLLDNQIYGYSLVDSLKAILELTPMELVKIYGYTTNRALIFSNVTSGRSSMVAIKVTNLKPSLVILHGPERVDEIAKRIAEIEGIVLGVSRAKNLSELKGILKRGFR